MKNSYFRAIVSYDPEYCQAGIRSYFLDILKEHNHFKSEIDNSPKNIFYNLVNQALSECFTDTPVFLSSIYNLGYIPEHILDIGKFMEIYNNFISGGMEGSCDDEQSGIYSSLLELVKGNTGLLDYIKETSHINIINESLKVFSTSFSLTETLRKTALSVSREMIDGHLAFYEDAFPFLVFFTEGGQIVQKTTSEIVPWERAKCADIMTMAKYTILTEDKKPYIRGIFDDNPSLLLDAIIFGNILLTEYLVELLEGEPVALFEKDELNKDALFYAVIYGDFDLAKKLIAKGAPLYELYESEGWVHCSILHIAAHNKRDDIVLYLLNEGNFPLEQKFDDGLSDLLDIAIHNNNVTLVKKILQIGKSYLFTNLDVENKIKQILSLGNIDMLNVFLNKFKTHIELFYRGDIYQYILGKDFSTKMLCPLLPILIFNESKIDNLLEYIVEKEESYLISVVLQDYSNRFLQPDNFKYSRKRKMLSIAIERGNINKVDFILNNEHLNITLSFYELFNLAIDAPNEAIIARLVEYFSAQEAPRGNLEAEMEGVSKSFYKSVLKELAESAIPHRVSDSSFLESFLENGLGYELVKLAFIVKEPKMIKLLRHNPEACKFFKEYFASSDFLKQENIEFFLNLDINIKAIDLNGRSLIFYAVLFKDVEKVTNLLDQGADIFHRDGRRKAPIDYAVQQGNLEITYKLLESYGSIDIDNRLDYQWRRGSSVLSNSIKAENIGASLLLINKCCSVEYIDIEDFFSKANSMFDFGEDITKDNFIETIRGYNPSSLYQKIISASIGSVVTDVAQVQRSGHSKGEDCTGGRAAGF